MGDGALRASLPEGVDARAALDALKACAGVVDAVVTEHFVAVYFDPTRPPEGLDDALSRASDAPASPTRLHEIRVRYDGPDLEDAAARLGLTPEELTRIHEGRAYRVLTMGFLPGFAYLGDVDARIELPRRDTPRPRIAAGSLAIAGRYTGVYPFASPGGWNLIGQVVGFAPFDAARGALLALGDRVRFVREP